MSRAIRQAHLLASRIRPRRSTMFVPGINTKALAKVRTPALLCDSFIVDLEDAVASNAKSKARDNVFHFLTSSSSSSSSSSAREIMVRINSLDTPWGLHDLSMISAAGGVDTVAVPKVETASDVWRVERLLDEMTSKETTKTKNEHPTLPMGIACMIETPLGVLNANEIAAASDNVVCLIVGTSDLTNDLRARHTKRREPMLTSLSMCVLAGRANGGMIYY